MRLLSPEKNLKGLYIKKPGVHARILLIFWYMKPQWKYITANYSVARVKGYHWPLFESRDKAGHFSILQVPAPGMSLMDILIRELIFMGGKRFILFGTMAILGDEFKWNQRLITTRAFGLKENRLISNREFTPIAVDSSKTAIETDKSLEKILEKSSLGKNYVRGPIWTTISPYTFDDREYDLAKKSGCIGVDMECLAFFSCLRETDGKALAVFYPRDRFCQDSWDKIKIPAEVKKKEGSRPEFIRDLSKDVLTILRNF